MGRKRGRSELTHGEKKDIWQEQEKKGTRGGGAV